jgi:hypothetical protein
MQPVRVEDWNKQTLGVGLIPRGQILAHTLWEHIGATVFSSGALCRIPDEVLKVVGYWMTGEIPGAVTYAGEGNTCDSVASSSPLDPNNQYPGKWSLNERVASIIACSVDREFTWRVLIILEEEGQLIGPRFEQPFNPLLQAARCVASRDDFVGVQLTIKTAPREDLSEGPVALTYSLPNLLMAPPLEQQAVTHALRAGRSKLADYVSSIYEQHFPKDGPKVDISGHLDDRHRSAALVLNSRERLEPSFLINYTQACGILGDFRSHGPFEQATQRMLRNVASEAKQNRIEECIADLHSKFTQHVEDGDLASLSDFAHAPISLALKRGGLSPISNEDKVIVHSAYVEVVADSDETAEHRRQAACTLILSIKRRNSVIVPTCQDYPRETDSGQQLLFSLHVEVTGTTTPLQLINKGLLDLKRDTGSTTHDLSADCSRSVMFCYGTLLSSAEFAEQLSILAGDKPAESLFHNVLLSSIKRHVNYRRERNPDHSTPPVEWSWAKLFFVRQPDAVQQDVQLLIRHSAGVSHFKISRNKDTGAIPFVGSPYHGGISHLQTILF